MSTTSNKFDFTKIMNETLELSAEKEKQREGGHWLNLQSYLSTQQLEFYCFKPMAIISSFRVENGPGGKTIDFPWNWSCFNEIRKAIDESRPYLLFIDGSMDKDFFLPIFFENTTSTSELIFAYDLKGIVAVKLDEAELLKADRIKDQICSLTQSASQQFTFKKAA